VHFVCRDCGGNLDVRYDYEAIRSQLNFEDPFPSERQDIFKYAALLPVDHTSAPFLRIGATPLYRVDKLAISVGMQHLYFKDDGLNPSASFKDRASAVAIARARDIGANMVAGASTGNAGSSMACMAAAVQMPCTVFVPEKAPPAKIAQLLLFGARVLAVRGSYDDAFDLCMRVCKDRHWFNRNTGHNPFTREGKKTCSFEICEQLEWQAPDRVVVPAGDGNIISGIWKGFRDLYAVGLIDRLPKLLCAQSELSAAISNTVRRLRAQGVVASELDWSNIEIESVNATTIADSISVDCPRDGLAAVRAVMESDGDVITVPDSEILQALGELANGAGIFAEPAAATGWACLKKLVAEGNISSAERVVCVITGNGLKDIASARRVAGEPVTIEPTLVSANEAIEQY